MKKGRIKSKVSCALAALGPENTFSSLAAKKYDPKAKIYYAKSLTEVFELVQKGKIKKGIVPIENKLTGSVAETRDLLFESSLKIQEEFILPIHHYLAALEKTPGQKIKTIYSHPQALRQCKMYLKKHFPKAAPVAVSSTATALKKIIAENLYDSAAICSKEAASAFDLPILDKNIEDYPFNETRFLVIGKKELPIQTGKKYKTSIAFYFSSDAPGRLYPILGEFAKEKINLTKIESAANPSVPGGHLFYIDFEGSAKDAPIRRILKALKKYTKKIKIMGSY